MSKSKRKPSSAKLKKIIFKELELDKELKLELDKILDDHFKELYKIFNLI